MKYNYQNLLLIILSLILSTNAFPSSDPFIAVYIDKLSEKKLGKFPYDRSLTANAIIKLRNNGAKAVVLKYFLDLPKPGVGDDKLALELKTIPVFLQATLDDNETKSNSIPENFAINSQITGDYSKILSGKNGWIPLPKFSKNAKAVGFVDVADPNKSLVPMVVMYQTKLIPSLWLSILEFEQGSKSQITMGKSLKVGKITLPLNEAGEVKYDLLKNHEMERYSFVDLLEDKINRKKIENKIVIIGVDTKSIPLVDSKVGKINIHRLFNFILNGLVKEN